MGLETVAHIDDLDATNPLGTDSRSKGDDHIRNIKLALTTDLPNISGAMTATHTELNVLDGVTAGTVTASKGVVVDSSSKVDVWNVDNITINGNSVTSTSGDLQLAAFSGTNLTLQDDADNTKEVTLDMSTVTTSTERTWTFPDKDGTFTSSASPTLTGTVTGPSGTWDAGGVDIAASDSYAVAGVDILSDAAGTMTLSNVDALDATTEATVEAAIDTLGNLTSASALVTVGALNSGSIATGFGNIDNGASSITTTGTITGGVVVADNININGNTIISTDTAGDINITPDTTGDIVLDAQKWPQADGNASEFLQTNGAGQLSWTAGSPAASVLTTHGDILFEDSGPANARLAAGTAGQVLTTQGSSADPTWTTPVSAASTTTFTNKTIDANGTGNSISNIDVADLANGTDGELITWDSAGAPTTVAVGTSTHVLTSNGTGAAPTFQAAASSGLTLGTDTNASSTGVTFGSIPSGTSLIFMTLEGVSQTGSNNFAFQVGDSGGLEVSGWINDSTISVIGAGTISGISAGGALAFQGDAAHVLTGTIMGVKKDDANNTWSWNAVVVLTGYNVYEVAMAAGVKSTTGELTQVRMDNNGSDTFDAGSINIAYM